MTDTAARSRVSAWYYALRTTNPPNGPIDAGNSLDRGLPGAAVLPMTLVAGLVVGLLAARAPGVD
ncbi:MAG: hypothetical protein ACRDS9_20880 [Pseudonocardiaceae bacterium]